MYAECRLCGHKCGVDRTAGRNGFCGESSIMRIACAGLHRGEEPPLSAGKGSGTIFFTGCTLRCSYCQNRQISGEGIGTEVSIEEFSTLCLDLEKKGACNINLVTGGHFAPSVVSGIKAAREQGLSVPVVWNSSGYDSPDMLDLLEGNIDIYLPDCKTVADDLAGGLTPAPDYGKTCVRAVTRMVAEKPLLCYEGEILKAGVIVRHLVVPGNLENTEKVLETFAARWKEKAFLSLMVQFEPLDNPAARAWHKKYGIPFRNINRGEYNRVLTMLDDYDIEDGFIQELTGSTEWSPDFTMDPVFPSSEFLPVWHWRRRE